MGRKFILLPTETDLNKGEMNMKKMRNILECFALALTKVGDNVSGAHYTTYHIK